MEDHGQICSRGTRRAFIRRIRRGARVTARTAVASAFVLVSAWQAAGNPTGGAVVAGSATIAQPSAAVTDIYQQSNRAIIDWKSFNIAPGETTQFIQPSSSAFVLNRVTGGDPSQIAGSLIANGSVALINGSGIFFLKGSEVDVNTLVATPSDISNANFMAGKLIFNIPPTNPTATVVNEGNISLADRGLGALVAPGVANSGVIDAKLGTVVLAGAKTFTVDLYGDGLINFDVTGKVAEVPATIDGKPATALVSNTGRISADGGTIELTAAAVDGIVSDLVSAGGTLAARSVGSRTGTVEIDGGRSTEGAVQVGGSVDVSGAGAGEPGGTVGIHGGLIDIAAGATINASGAAGGGAVRVDGIQATTVAAGTSISADAVDTGNGGEVVVRSHGATTFAGTISALGGVEGGNGGFIETSGTSLDIGASARVDASARGTAGTWLLDPTNIDIGPTLASTINASPINVAVQASGSITVNSSLTPQASLGLDAGNDIVLNAEINFATNASNGSLALQAGGSITQTAGEITMAGGTLSFSAGSGIGTPSAAIATVGVANLAATTATGGIFIANGNSGDVAIAASGGLILTAGSSPTTVGTAVDDADTALNELSGGTGANALVIATQDLPVDPVSFAAVTGLSATDPAASGDVALENAAGSITLSDAVTAATGNVFLEADGTGSTISGGGVITAGSGESLSLVAAAGVGTSGTPLSVGDSGALTVAAQTATGGVYLSLSDASGATVGAAAPPSYFTTTTVAGVVASTSGDVAVQNGTGSITLSDAVTAAAGNVFLEADGTGSTISGGGVITAGSGESLSLVAAAGVGTSGTPLSVGDSGALTVAAQTATGGVYLSLSDASGATVGAAAPPSYFTTTTVAGVVASTSGDVAVQNGTGSITLSDAVTAAAGNVFLEADGTGSTISGGGVITVGSGESLSLVAAAGVGTSGTPLSVGDSGALTVAAQTATGGVYLSLSDASGATVGAAAPPSYFTTTTVAGVVASTSGDVAVQNGTGSITLSDAVTAAAGNVFLEADGTGSTISGGGVITAGSGESLSLVAAAGVGTSGTPLSVGDSGALTVAAQTATGGVYLSLSDASGATVGAAAPPSYFTTTTVAGVLASTSGDISLGNGSGAIVIAAPVTAAGGDVSLAATGVTVDAGKALDAGADTLSVSAGAGALTLDANSLLLTTGAAMLTADTVSFASSSQIGGDGIASGEATSATIEPSTANRTIGLGSGAGMLSLSQSTLDRVFAANVTVGVASAGLISVGNFQSVATFANGGTFGLVSGDGIAFGGSLDVATNSGAALSASAGNTVSQSAGTILAYGTTVTLTTAGKSVSLNQAGNDFDMGSGALSVVGSSASNAPTSITVQDGSAVQLGNVATSGMFALTASGDVTQIAGSSVTAAGTAITLAAAGHVVTLNNQSSGIGLNALTSVGGSLAVLGSAASDDPTAVTVADGNASGLSLGVISTTSDGTLTVAANGALTQTAALSVGATSSFRETASGATITLADAGNLLTGAVTLGTVGSSGAASVTNGVTTVLAAMSIGGALTVDDKAGSLSQSGALSVGGASSFTTEGSNATITLTNASNALTGAVALDTTGPLGAASLTNGVATVLAASSVGGTLTVDDKVGSLSQSGALIVGGTSSFTTEGSNATITLADAGNLLTGAVTLGTVGSSGDASMTNGVTTVLAAMSIGGALTVDDKAGSLSQSGALTVGGASSFTTEGSNATITLANANNELSGAVTLATTGASADASVVDGDALEVGGGIGGRATLSGPSLRFDALMAGALSATAVTGGIAQTGGDGLVVSGTTSLTAATADQTITLANANNALTGAVTLATTGSLGAASVTNGVATVLAASSVGGTLTVDDKAGSLSQSGPLIVGGSSSFTTEGGNATITLANANNALAGGVALDTTGSSGAASVTNGVATALAASSVGGALTVDDKAGSLSQSGALSVGGASSFTTEGSNATITLTNASNALTGAVALDTTGSLGAASLTNGVATVLAASSVGGTLTVDDKAGSLSQSGALIVGGTSVFITEGSNATITLADAGNLLTGAVTLGTVGSSGAASVTNGVTTVLAAMSIGGALTVDDKAGSLSQSGALSVGGASSFTTEGSNATITLTNASNALTGAVALDTTGPLGAASLTNGVATVLAASSVGGTLTVDDKVGSLSQSGALIVGGTSSFTTEGSNATITLADAGNLLTGAVTLGTVGSSGDASMTNGVTTVLAAMSIGGALTVDDKAGSLSQSGALTVGGASSFTTEGSNATITLANANNELSGAVTLATTGASADASVVDGDALEVGGGIGGRATLSGPSLRFDALMAGALSATAVTGGIAQTGGDGLVVSGTTSLTAATADQTITLANANNALTGAVTLATTGSLGAASVTNGVATVLAASSVGGTLTVDDKAGSLSQSGPLIVGGSSTSPPRAATRPSRSPTPTTRSQAEWHSTQPGRRALRA